MNGNDQLLINSDQEDMTLIEFKPESGAVLKAHIQSSGLVKIDYTCQFGSNYTYSSNASNFKIPNLIHDAKTG